jgi:hypothetical protein
MCKCNDCGFWETDLLRFRNPRVDFGLHLVYSVPAASHITVDGARGTEEVVGKALSVLSDFFRQPPPSPSNVCPPVNGYRHARHFPPTAQKL